MPEGRLAGSDGGVFRQTKATKASGKRPRLADRLPPSFTRPSRQGDPDFDGPETAAQWYQTRREVIHHLLTFIEGSYWRNYVVLRGSLLLKAWLGDAAREPGDVDWIFQPASVGPDSDLANDLFQELRRFIQTHPYVGAVELDAYGITEDDVFAYNMSSGRRIIFPWKYKGLPGGEVRMDVAFNEKLFAPPVETEISLVESETVSLWTATTELSLAWKLLWLETDFRAQGKDLYDAVLLAEQTRLPLELLQQVLNRLDVSPDFPLKWPVNWDTFKAEYPWVEGNAKDWQRRLTRALRSTFEGGV